MSSYIAQSPCNRNGNGTFHSLAEQTAAVFVNTLYRAGSVICVCGTSARAVKLCPAVLAVLTGINVAAFEFVLDLFVVNTVPYIAELEFFVADELVAGIKVAPRGDRHIFGTRAASRNALIDAGTARKVDHIVLEGKGLAFLFALDHKLGKLFILIEEDGHIRFKQFALVTLCANDGLHTELGKA